jgi:hypothetical protein
MKEDETEGTRRTNGGVDKYKQNIDWLARSEEII